MPPYSYPGVYLEEIASGIHPIAGVPTSVAAFVGWAARGPIDEATMVGSFTEFARQYGGLDPRSYLGYAVNQFFLNGGQQAYIVRLVSDGRAGSTAARSASIKITELIFDSTAAPAPCTVTITTAGSGGLTVMARNPGAWGNNCALRFAPNAEDYTRFDLSVLFTGPTTHVPGIVEDFVNLSPDPNDAQARYVLAIVNGQSQFITLAMGSAALAVTNQPKLPLSPLPPPGSATISLSGGNDGTLLNPAPKPGPGPFEFMLNASGSTTGLHLLDTVPINVLVVPGEADPSTIVELQAYCVDRRAFLIVDSAPAETFATLQTGPSNLVTSGSAMNSAFYFPWINALDEQQNITRPFPPSGFVAGIYAAIDSSRGVWRPPAGESARLIGSSGVDVPLTDAQIGALNAQGIDCIRYLAPYGVLVWGARTLRGNDQFGSEWKYVPVRRVALYIESSLYEGTQWVVFEPNNEQLWSQIRLNVGAFMHGLFLQGAFQGSTPEQAYFVKCDSENNPQASIDQGIVNILVGFAALRPAEFVVITLKQIAPAGGTSFPTENVAYPVPQDAYAKFRYRLKSEGKCVAGASQMGHLMRTTEVIETRDAGDSLGLPGQTRYGAITLERGLTLDSEFNAWASHVPTLGRTGVDIRKELELEVCNEVGQSVIIYKIHRCWVSEYRVLPDLDADPTAITIQHIKLENDGWDCDTSIGQTPQVSALASQQPVVDRRIIVSPQKPGGP